MQGKREWETSKSRNAKMKELTHLKIKIDANSKQGKDLIKKIQKTFFNHCLNNDLYVEDEMQNIVFDLEFYQKEVFVKNNTSINHMRKIK